VLCVVIHIFPCAPIRTFFFTIAWVYSSGIYIYDLFIVSLKQIHYIQRYIHMCVYNLSSGFQISIRFPRDPITSPSQAWYSCGFEFVFYLLHNTMNVLISSSGSTQSFIKRLYLQYEVGKVQTPEY
jgi:hypothetical protein